MLRLLTGRRTKISSSQTNLAAAKSLLMVRVQRTGAGRGPGWAGLWTGEVILHCVSPRGTHDLRTERRTKEITNEEGKE